jgi:hypothetical protein
MLTIQSDSDYFLLGTADFVSLQSILAAQDSAFQNSSGVDPILLDVYGDNEFFNSKKKKEVKRVIFIEGDSRRVLRPDESVEVRQNGKIVSIPAVLARATDGLTIQYERYSGDIVDSSAYCPSQDMHSATSFSTFGEAVGLEVTDIEDEDGKHWVFHDKQRALVERDGKKIEVLGSEVLPSDKLLKRVEIELIRENTGA